MRGGGEGGSRTKSAVLAVRFPGPGRVEMTEAPRPSVTEPTDVVLLVTTAAISPLDVAAFRDGSPSVPGHEFAGVVVEAAGRAGVVEVEIAGGGGTAAFAGVAGLSLSSAASRRALSLCGVSVSAGGLSAASSL